MALLNNPDQRALRRSLRKRMTPAERTLWFKLKSNRLAGHKFRRQTSIGRYVVDFYCAEKKLILEIDGDAHYFGPRQRSDQEREYHLAALGFKILRFTNQQIKESIDAVLERILSVLNSKKEF